MRPEKMTTKSQEAVRGAIELAARRGSPEVIPEHLLLSVIAQEDGVAFPLLQKAGTNIDAVIADATKVVSGLPVEEAADKEGDLPSPS